MQIWNCFDTHIAGILNNEWKESANVWSYSHIPLKMTSQFIWFWIHGGFFLLCPFFGGGWGGLLSFGVDRSTCFYLHMIFTYFHSLWYAFWQKHLNICNCIYSSDTVFKNLELTCAFFTEVVYSTLVIKALWTELCLQDRNIIEM